MLGLFVRQKLRLVDREQVAVALHRAEKMSVKPLCAVGGRLGVEKDAKRSILVNDHDGQAAYLQFVPDDALQFHRSEFEQADALTLSKLLDHGFSDDVALSERIKVDRESLRFACHC